MAGSGCSERLTRPRTPSACKAAKSSCDHGSAMPARRPGISQLKLDGFEGGASFNGFTTPRALINRPSPFANCASDGSLPPLGSPPAPQLPDIGAVVGRGSADLARQVFAGEGGAAVRGERLPHLPDV